MKKTILVAITLFVVSLFASSQNVGIGTNTPASSALLEVTANNKGLLVPRVTNVQMNGIASPANGLLVYNTDSAAFAYRAGAAWVFLKGNTTASNDWSTKGNACTNVNTNFIGTTDNVPFNFRVNNLNAGSINPIPLNTFLGREAGNTTQTGERNVAIGFLSLPNNDNGVKNIALTGAGVYCFRRESTL